MVYFMENPIKMDEDCSTPISGNAQWVVFLPSDILACQVHLAKVKSISDCVYEIILCGVLGFL